MRILLQTPPEHQRAPRFCLYSLQQDLLEGWTLLRETGYQGYAGQLKREHFADREQAEQALIKGRDALTKRGYRVVYSEGQPHP